MKSCKVQKIDFLQNFAAKTDEHHRCCQMPGNRLSADEYLLNDPLHLMCCLAAGNNDGARLSLLQNPKPCCGCYLLHWHSDPSAAPVMTTYCLS